eukprot:GHUV01018966.1.p1 GENE.GHUV01018966.1~~GHUV01018966.1.p1  ORF type:complete len:307 (+),score=67.63 GHUV01018966.1:355-1275(+)
MQSIYRPSCGHMQLLAVAALLCCLLSMAAAYTDPDQFTRLAAFRDAMQSRSGAWKEALQTWTCPTPPRNSDGTCDPCGRLSDGNWYHMHCRGNSRGWGESGDGTLNGLITNSHITSEKVDGPVPKEECVLSHLREFDYGGREGLGRLSGPLPRWLGECFPMLEEMDLSCNKLTGTLPEYLAKMPLLTEVKVQENQLIGTIPEAFGRMKRGARRFQVEHNHMHGRIPDSFKNPTTLAAIAELHLAGNDFEGTLDMFAGSHLTTVTVHENPKLCGMVPHSVRYAKGYNPAPTWASPAKGLMSMATDGG